MSLDGVALEFHNGSGAGWMVVWRAPNGIVLAPDALFVLGDDAVTPAPNVVFALALQNGPDAIRLVDANGAVLDMVGYGGLDDAAYVETLGAAVVDAGQSIARTPDGRDTGDNASDFVAATPTPGRRNVARYDAAPALSSGHARARGTRSPRRRTGVVDIQNLGLVDIPAGAVMIAVGDSSDSDVRETDTVQNVDVIMPGASERVTLDVTFTAPGYHWISIVARYSDDERIANDRVSLRASRRAAGRFS